MPKSSSLNIVSLKETLNREKMINQALIDLLVEKGVITKAELMEKIEKVNTKVGENKAQN